MLKNLAIISIAVVVSNLTMAAPAPYVGASLGITTNTPTNHEATFSSFRGVPLKVFTGYSGMVHQNFYLAGELGLTLITGELSSKRSSLKTDYGYGVSLLPGVMLSDHTAAFARTGVVRSHFSHSDKTVTGGQIGLGLQTSVTQNVDLRGEYDFTAYNSVKYQNSRTAPNVDAINLALVYKFE